jgi:hypothetical protein
MTADLDGDPIGTPALGVWKAQLARSVYRAPGRPTVEKTWAKAVMTAGRDSLGQSWA